MKRFLPILLLVLVGLIVTGGAFWLLKGSKQTTNQTEQQDKKEEIVQELPIDQRPYVAMTPRADGKEFHLTVEKFPAGIQSFDYELNYQTSAGVGEGVFGTVKLKGESKIERDLLLGSCSSGKCRYHEGVEEGKLTLRLRDTAGKLKAKMETQFHLQSGASALNMPDDSMTFKGTGLGKSGYYIIMSTFGLPATAPGSIISGPYAVFSKSPVVTGTVEMKGDGILYVWNGSKWAEVKDGKSMFGTFIKVTK